MREGAPAVVIADHAGVACQRLGGPGRLRPCQRVDAARVERGGAKLAAARAQNVKVPVSFVSMCRRQDLVGRPRIRLRLNVATGWFSSACLRCTRKGLGEAYVAHLDETTMPLPFAQPTVNGLLAIFPPHARPAHPAVATGATTWRRMSNGADATSGMAMRKVRSLTWVSEKQMLVPPGQNLCVTSCLFSTAAAEAPSSWTLLRASRVSCPTPMFSAVSSYLFPGKPSRSRLRPARDNPGFLCHPQLPCQARGRPADGLEAAG